MTPKIRVEKIQWFDTNPIKSGDTDEDAYPGCDGAVMYEIVWPPEENPNGWHVGYIMQPFRKGDSHGHIPGRSQDDIAKNRANFWAWDGNRDAPSLTPSFLCVYPGAGIPEVRVHLYLTAGKISLCSDSTVSLV